MTPMTEGPTPRAISNALIQVCLANMLMFATGALFSFGVYAVPVELNANPVGALDGVWPAAMGLFHSVSAPIMIITGIYLDSARPGFKTARGRILAALGAFAFAAFVMAAHGAAQTQPAWITFGVGIQALPLDYLLATELLVSWVPNRPGLAVGSGQVACGLGAILIVWVSNFLLSMLSIVNAIRTVAVLLCGITLLPTLFLRWPEEGQVGVRTDDSGAEEPLLGDTSVKVPWLRLTTTTRFWLYVVVVFTAGASYAFISFFFKLGHAFGKPSSLVVRCFQMTSLASTLFGLLASTLTDMIGFGKGFFHSGAKNLTMFFLALQTGLFLLLIPVSAHGQFVLFVLLLGVLKMFMASHAGCAALLARDLFGPANSCVVFGIGGGLALGSGEGLSAWLMSMVEATNTIPGMPRVPTDYAPFYRIGAVWSLLGLVCVAALRRYGEAFVEKPMNSETFSYQGV